MALRKLERINYRGKWPVSMKYQNLHSFKEGLILLCQSILETRRITHLRGSPHFTIALMKQAVKKKAKTKRNSRQKQKAKRNKLINKLNKILKSRF